MFGIFTNVNASYSNLAYDYTFNSIDGNKIKLEDFKGKVIVVVNVASRCGYTPQYEDLQELWTNYQKKDLVVIGVPTNNFKQEPGSNKEIKKFCETNFNITFPMTSKYDVKGTNAHPVYLWAKNNYGKSAVPKWNFHKILINKQGVVEDTFASFTNPMSNKIIKKLEEIL